MSSLSPRSPQQSGQDLQDARVGELLSTVTSDVQQLFRQEVELAD